MSRKLIVKRAYKEIYRDGDTIIKVFSPEHPKANVFNEALNHARVEETGLPLPKVLEVSQRDNRWALTLEYVEGKTMAELLEEHPEKTKELLEQFVDLQLTMHTHTVPKLNSLREKLSRQIDEAAPYLDATTRYELHTRLNALPRHHKLCHGDFQPSNIIVSPKNGKCSILDWSHATIGNASADAARTYLMFALKDQTLADRYLTLFCSKSDTARQYVQQWMPIVAAAQLSRGREDERDFLLKWCDIIDFQ